MMLKYLLLGMAAAMIAVPVRAQAAELSCAMSPAEQQKFIAAGLPDNAKQVMHLIVDKHAHKVTVWETAPGASDVSKATYKAKFKGAVAAWAIGDIKDGPQAHDTFDTQTNTLTTIDPMGDATQWNCSAG
jgi:hypothetical protein